jgi:3'-phosphoadenosine 5'-phosphosulfate sulfotransferase (PAPS reductase)/FAD synthetase
MEHVGRLIERETPEEWIERARVLHDPIATVCLFSGGSDSLVVAHRCRDYYDELVFIDTGTALPGVLDHVRQCAEDLEKPLRVMSFDYDAYRLAVVGGDDPKNQYTWHPFGFPGPAQHGRMYNRLKERQIFNLLRELKKGHPRHSRVVALSGVRQDESSRRAKRPAIFRTGSMVFVSPLIEWTNVEMQAYRNQHDLRLSDVAALIHRSGECNCGAYADADEREMLKSLFPKWWAERIEPIEREAEAKGLGCAKWGTFREFDAENLSGAGPLCSSCDAMMDARQGSLFAEGNEND